MITARFGMLAKNLLASTQRYTLKSRLDRSQKRLPSGYFSTIASRNCHTQLPYTIALQAL